MPDTPLTFVHSNRVERLADALAVALRSMPEAMPLAAPHIVVPHVGLGRWLERALAERLGIAFGLRFVLPGQFLWELDRRLFGTEREDDPYAVGALALRILGALRQDAGGSEWEPMRRLARDDDPAGRVASARALAERYDRYLTHWPDMLRRWERGPGVDLPWQGQVWRTLRRGLPEPGRVAMLERLGRALRERTLDPVRLPAAVHLFGLHLMPRPYWQVLDALANEVPTIVYLPHASAELSADVALEGSDGDATHPLLDRLGALERGFLRLAFEGERPRQVEGYAVPIDGVNLLARVQRSLLEGSAAARPEPMAEADASMRVHACAGRWREVEVLRDVLVRRFQEQPDLRLSDVVVMVPDPGAYASCFAQLFEHEDPTLRLPYRLVDRAEPEAGLLLEFLGLLRPGPRRTTLAEVSSLCARAELAARFELEPDELEACADWLREAGVRWGMDRTERLALGAGADLDGSFELAARRLLLGYAHGEGAIELGGLAPLALAEGQGAAALGRVLELLETLRGLRELLARELPPGQWPREVLARFDALYAPARDDTCERERARLAAALAELAEDAELAGNVPALSGALLHGLLRERVARAGGELPSGLITICGMVPLRSVPFRLVALLGLDADAFPRRERVRAFECVPELRPGERAIAQDDRHAFLEALMSARAALHLSWSAIDPGRGAQQDPSAVLDELEAFLERLTGWKGERERAPWRRTHPAAPFDPRAFHPVAAEPGYARHWALAGAGMLLPSAPPAFAIVRRDQQVAREAWSLTELKRCLVQPAKYWLRQTGVRAETPEIEQWEESGGVDGLQRYRTVERALDLIDSGLDDPEALALQLQREGGLPAGALGRIRAAELAAQALALAAMRRELVAGRGQSPRAPFELECAGQLVLGTAHGRYGDRVVRAHPGNLHARNCFAGWLDGLALAASGVPLVEVVLIGLEEKVASCKRIELGDDASKQLERLLTVAGLAAHRPLPLFPKSGLAYVEALHEGAGERTAMQRAWNCWHGGHQKDGECAESGFALYTRDWPDPLAPPFADLAREVHGTWVERTRRGS